MVSPGYFDSFGIPIVSGRAPGDQDAAQASTVVWVNLTVARLYFSREQALGQQITGFSKSR